MVGGFVARRNIEKFNTLDNGRINTMRSIILGSGPSQDLEQFKNMGLVKFDKKGRIKLIKLTEQGLDVAHDFEGINRKFKRLGAFTKELGTKKEIKKKTNKK